MATSYDHEQADTVKDHGIFWHLPKCGYAMPSYATNTEKLLDGQ